MITIFSVPKPFKGHIGVIQRNAIMSWKQAFPGCQIILFGTDLSTEKAAAELGVECRNVSSLSPLGAPLLNDIFDQAIRHSTNNTLCFSNTDILFKTYAPKLSELPSPFLVVGESYDTDIRNSINFKDNFWQERLPNSMESRGPFALDYFFFTRGLFQHLPPFRVGRARYDNWLIYRGLREGACIIDGTIKLGAIHQKHTYSHLEGGQTEAYRGADAKFNEKIAGWWCSLYLYSVYDAQKEWIGTGLVSRQRHGIFLRQLGERFNRRIRELLLKG